MQKERKKKEQEEKKRFRVFNFIRAGHLAIFLLEMLFLKWFIIIRTIFTSILFPNAKTLINGTIYFFQSCNANSNMRYKTLKIKKRSTRRRRSEKSQSSIKWVKKPLSARRYIQINSFILVLILKTKMILIMLTILPFGQFLCLQICKWWNFLMLNNWIISPYSPYSLRVHSRAPKIVITTHSKCARSLVVVRCFIKH